MIVCSGAVAKYFVAGTVTKVYMYIVTGTKLGLFKALSELSQSQETAVTSTQLADSLNYKER